HREPSARDARPVNAPPHSLRDLLNACHEGAVATRCVQYGYPGESLAEHESFSCPLTTVSCVSERCNRFASTHSNLDASRRKLGGPPDPRDISPPGTCRGPVRAHPRMVRARPCTIHAAPRARESAEGGARKCPKTARRRRRKAPRGARGEGHFFFDGGAPSLGGDRSTNGRAFVPLTPSGRKLNV